MRSSIFTPAIVFGRSSLTYVLENQALRMGVNGSHQQSGFFRSVYHFFFGTQVSKQLSGKEYLLPSKINTRGWFPSVS